MKKVKKIIVSFLLMCMLCVGMTCVASATTAEFRFSDPQTSVGAEVEVTAKVSSARALNTIQATLSYDKTKLRFISGDDATGGDGTITISRNDENAGTSMEFNLTFQALDEGTTSIEVAKVDGIDNNGVALEVTSGSSSVSISEGDKSLIQEEDTGSVADGTEVKVGKTKYIVTDDFSDTIIPDGFVRDTLKFEGTDHQIIKQESSGALAMYLTPEKGGDADFYLYDSDTGSFSQLEVIEVAKGRYIIPLSDDGKLSLPDQYQKATLTLNGKEFDTWQDTNDAEYYIVYAMNSDGEKTTYRYDTTDGTYQKYTPSVGSASSGTTTNNGKGIWGKILNFVESFLDIVVIIAFVLFVVLLIAVIVTSVKLHYRDLELDDLYDEYGIDMDEEEEEKKIQKKAAKKADKAKKKAKKSSKKPVSAKESSRYDYDEDEFEDYEDDFDDEDPWVTENIAKAMERKPAKKQPTKQKKSARHTEPEREKRVSKGVHSLDETGPAIRKPVKKINLEDTNDFEAFAPLDEEEFDNFEGYYSEDDDYDMFGEDSYDDEDLFDATSDLLSNHPEKRKSHAEMDDTFKMDVIDLD